VTHAECATILKDAWILDSDKKFVRHMTIDAEPTLLVQQLAEIFLPVWPQRGD